MFRSLFSSGTVTNASPANLAFSIRARVLRSSVVTATAIIAMAGCAASSQNGVTVRSSQQSSAGTPSLDAVTEGFGPAVRADVEKLRTATAPYHDVKVAQVAGYPTATPACISDSTMGGMGRHYFDRAVYDEKLDIAHPEMLIYAPSDAGQPDHLVGVEYVIPFRLLPSTEKPPRLFGQELKRHEDFKYWYLHVWAWRKNSAGLFSDWDPSIKCS
ncbi:MAG: hypothetical protein ABJB74_13775 [Gemmatimonas sp.]